MGIEVNRWVDVNAYMMKGRTIVSSSNSEGENKSEPWIA